MNPLPRLIRLAVAANFAVALSVTHAQVDTAVHSPDPPSARVRRFRTSLTATAASAGTSPSSLLRMCSYLTIRGCATLINDPTCSELRKVQVSELQL
jgi:hypothetical protein